MFIPIPFPHEEPVSLALLFFSIYCGVFYLIETFFDFLTLCNKSTKRTDNRSKQTIKIKENNKLATRKKDRWSNYYKTAVLFSLPVKVKNGAADISILKYGQ